MNLLSLEELEKLYKENKAKTNAIKTEINIRLAKLKNDKKAKISLWIINEFALKYVSRVSLWRIRFCVDGKIYNVRFYQRGEIQIENIVEKNEHLYYYYVNGKHEFNDFNDFYRCLGLEKSYVIERHNLFIKNNPKLFEYIASILMRVPEIFGKYRKYKKLFFKTNYMQCLTFLFCTKQIFPRDISKLIAHKILFFCGSFGSSVHK